MLGLALFLVSFVFTNQVHAGVIVKSPAYLGLQRGLVGCWSFDGASAKAPDCSENNNVGTLTGGPTKIEGKVGQALNFDGVDDRVDFDWGGPSPVNLTDMTISAWIKADSFSADEGHIFGNCCASTGRFTLRTETTGKLSFAVVSNCPFCSDTTADILETNRWYHVSVVYTDANRDTKLYINGSERTKSQDDTPVDDLEINIDGSIGRRPDNNDEFDGLIDEVRTYNRALSANEISRLYRIGLGSTANRGASASPLDKGLVGHWTFDSSDISGTRAKDRSGFLNHGTLTNGPTVNQGKVGQALRFPGSNPAEHVIIDNSSASPYFRGLTSITVSAWIMVTPQYFNATKFVVAKSNLASQREFRLRTNVDNQFELSLSVDGTNTVDSVNPNVIPVGQWAHLVGTWSGATDVQSLYVDGVLVDSDSLVGTTLFSGTANVTIGASADVEIVTGWEGLIDEVRIYNRALSAGEISRLYNSTQSKYNSSKTGDVLTKGLVGHWTFDGTDIGLSGTQAKDRSGFLNHGTLTNGPVVNQGKIGQALSFDGVNDTVLVPDSNSLHLPNTSFTLSFWLKANSLSNDPRLLAKRETFNTMDWILYWGSGVSAFFLILGENQGDAVSFAYNPSLIDAWHNIVITKSGSNCVLFHNGVYRDTQICGFPWTDSDDLYIGSQAGATNFLDGLMDDVRIYNRALSAGEVNKLYQMGR